MKNEASKTRTLDIAFVVDADLLKRLEVILKETSEALEYTITFSDGTSVHYGDMKGIIGLPNSDQRSIVSLIAGTAGEKSKSGFVSLKKDSPSLEYTIYGSQRDVVYFASQLDDWVSAIRQWYSPFISSESGSSGAGLFLIAALFGLPLYSWERISRLSPALDKAGAYHWVALPTVVAMYAAEYYMLRLFPRGIFAIGQGAKQNQFNIYIRTAVLGGLVLSLIAGVLANLITRHL
jgi:hypothetical protein